jgi:hypothetical protein
MPCLLVSHRTKLSEGGLSASYPAIEAQLSGHDPKGCWSLRGVLHAEHVRFILPRLWVGFFLHRACLSCQPLPLKIQEGIPGRRRVLRVFEKKLMTARKNS